jgi:PleD family two-component response regulator
VVRCSVGVASYLSPPPTVDALIHGADTLMYRAKEQGKDRIESAEIEGRPPVTNAG